MPRSEPTPSPFYRVSVKAVVSNDAGCLLVVQNEHGSWEVPGGGWEHGETFEEALRREISEELGVEVTHIDTTTVHPCVGFSRHGRAWLKLLVPATLSGPPFQFGDGMRAAKFVSPEAFAELTMHPADRCLQTDPQRFWPVHRDGPERPAPQPPLG